MSAEHGAQAGPRAGERTRAAARRTDPGSPAQVAAMVSLLADENPEIVARCRAALVTHGEVAEPLLRERLAAVDAGNSPREDRLLRRVLADLHADEREQQVRDLLQDGAELEAGALVIGRLVDGGDGPEGAGATLDEWAGQIAAARGDDGDVDRGVVLLRRTLGRAGLEGTPPHRADLHDALLHGVTARRRGMPLPLCMTWILLARRVGLPLVGVNMPGHFLLRVDVPDRLLILDPFHDGVPLDLDVCRRYLAAQGQPSSNLLALDASDREMLLRTLRNVVHLSLRHGEKALAERCSKLLRAVDPRGM